MPTLPPGGSLSFRTVWSGNRADMFGSIYLHTEYGPPHRDLPTTQVSWSDAAIQPTDDAVFVDSTFEGNAVPFNSFYVPGWHSSALYIRGPWKVDIVRCAFRNNEGPVAPESWNGAWNQNYASKGAYTWSRRLNQHSAHTIPR